MTALSTQPVIPGPARRDRCLEDQQFQSLLSETLTEPRQRRFSAHIEQCERCQQRLEQLVSDVDCALPVRENEATSQLAQAEDLVTCWQRAISESIQEHDATTSQRHTRSVDGETHDLEHLQDDTDITLQDFGPWRSCGLAGEGGMAVVFRAHDVAINKPVAVKVLRNRYTSHEAVRTQFLQEVAIQSRLRHPGIPRIYESGTLPNGRLYIEMEYRHGRTLSHIMRHSCPHEMTSLLDAFGRVCEVVAVAHQERIRHRDLKPANILIDANGNVSVLDWGLAESWRESPGDVRYLPRAISRFCHTVVGTPGYIAPEQIEGRSVGPTADVYALGVILAEILSGERLSADERDGVCAGAVRKASARLIESLEAQGVREPLVELVKRCLSARPGDRPGSAGELLLQLNRCREGRSPDKRSPANQQRGRAGSGRSRMRIDQQHFAVHPSGKNPGRTLLDRCKKSDSTSFNDWKGTIVETPFLH